MCDNINTGTDRGGPVSNLSEQLGRVQGGEAGAGFANMNRADYKRHEIAKALSEHPYQAVSSGLPSDYELRDEMNRLTERAQRLGILRQVLNQPVGEMNARTVIHLHAMCRELGFSV